MSDTDSSPVFDYGPTSDGEDSQEKRRRGFGRIWTAAVVGGRDVLRDPVLIGVLVVLPAYFVGLWGSLVPDEELPVSVASGTGSETVVATMPELMTAVIAPVTGALVAGIAALFLVQRSVGTDRRLVVVGYRRPEILLARVCVLAVIIAVVVAVSTAAVGIYLTPEHLGWFVLALVCAAGAYGAVGAIIGTVFGRTAGVYLLLFVPMLDIVLLQSPLADTPEWATWLPGHHPTELATSAAFAPEVAVGHSLWALGYLAVLAILAGSFYRL